MDKGFTVLVDWDTADAIMEQQLLYTYCSLTNDIKKLKAKKKLQAYEKEDLEMFERVLGGIEIAASWYVFDFEKKVKKYAKRKV